MTKELHKADMKRFKLTNKFLKSKLFSDRKAYRSQSNFCKLLLRNIKKTLRKLLITIHFWKTVVPLFSTNMEKINLTEENEIILTDRELSRVFSTFLSKTVKEHKIQSVSNFTHNESNSSLKETLK